MKKQLLSLVLLAATLGVHAQIQTNNGINTAIINSNVMIDGSTAFSTESGAPANIGRIRLTTKK